MAAASTMIKTLFVFDSLNRGGAEIWALDVCRNANASVIDLTFVATGGGSLEEDFKTSGVEFVRLERRSALDLRLVRELRKLIRDGDFKIVHSNQPVDALHVHLATIGIDVKHVMSFHGHIPDAKNLWASRYLYLCTDANVIGTHEFETMLMKELKLPFGKPCEVVAYGVDDRRLRSDKSTVRDVLGLPDNALLLGMVANFYAAPRKDHMTVCRALPTVFRKFPNADFIFVHSGGQDEDSGKLQACVDYCEAHGISERVHFAENRFDARDVLHSLDVFVLSTLHESFGIAVVEAMLTGVPCILSDIPALIEISNSGEYAALFRTSDADDLAKKVIDLLDNPAERQEIGRQAREWAADNFSIDANLRSLVRLYKDLIDG